MYRSRSARDALQWVLVVTVGQEVCRGFRVSRCEKPSIPTGSGLGDSGLSGWLNGSNWEQSKSGHKWAISRIANGLSNRCQLDPLSGRSYNHSLKLLELCPPGCAGGEK